MKTVGQPEKSRAHIYLRRVEAEDVVFTKRRKVNATSQTSVEALCDASGRTSVPRRKDNKCTDFVEIFFLKSVRPLNISLEVTFREFKHFMNKEDLNVGA